jgi:hypothetical protein
MRALTAEEFHRRTRLPACLLPAAAVGVAVRGAVQGAAGAYLSLLLLLVAAVVLLALHAPAVTPQKEQPQAVPGSAGGGGQVWVPAAVQSGVRTATARAQLAQGWTAATSAQTQAAAVT